MIIQTGGRRLGETGNYGALEAYVSLPSLEERIQSQLRIGRESSLPAVPPEHITFPALLEALERNDSFVREMFLETASYLGVGLANMINTLLPEYVIVGGALVNADPLVYETAVNVARKIYLTPQAIILYSLPVFLEKKAL